MKTPTSQPLSFPVRLTRSLRTPLWKKTVSSILLAQFALWSVQVKGATYDWDPSITGGVTLGGAGTWNTANTHWWNGSSNIAWPILTDTARFGGASGGLVTLGSAITAGGLTFNTTGYNIAGGGNSLTLTPASGFNSPIIAVNNNGLGTNQATISSSLTGTSGFSKTGNGTLRISADNSSTLSGDIAIKGGNVVITNANQLGSTTGTAISVTGAANTTGATGGTGFTGGALVLHGSSVSASSTAGITLNRELTLAGRGPGANNATGALVSIGYNTLAGGLTMGNAVGETRLWATHGTTTVSGPVFVGASAISGFQGNGNFNISGRVSGLEASDDRFYKTGSLIASTLWLQNASNDFRSTMRVDSGTVRVGSVGALGLNTSSTSVDLVNGTLEVRTDAASAFSTKNVRIRNNAGGTIFVDRDLSGPLSLGSGSLQNQTVTFGSLTREAGANTSTWNISGRNGYSAFFTTATPAAGDYRATTINNNSSGTLTLAGGNVWNANNAIAGGYTVQGGGETIINGAVLASGAAHSLTKGNSGTFTLGSTAATTSTFLGNANLNDGTLAIRSVNALNPTSASAGRVVFGNGALSFLGAESTGAGETWTNKIADLNTANAYILANQSGSAPSALILPNNFAVSNGAAKTLHLGGSAPTSIVNQITGLITNGGNLTNINKFGTSTWEIAAPTSYGSSATLSLAATGATATTTVTLATGNTTGLVVGQPISGLGIPVGTTITQIRDSTTLILSGNRAASTAADPAVSVGVASGITSTITNTVASTGTANPVITVASTVNLVPGQKVTSTNLPASQNWYIRDITSGTTVTLVSGTGASLVAGAVAAAEVITPQTSPNFGGNLTVANGILRLNAASASSDIINSTSNLIFNTDSVTLMGNAGGTFNYVGFAGGTSTEVLGRLIPTAGQGIVSITNGTGNDTLTFLDIGTRGAGATLDYQPGTGIINFNGIAPAGSNGIQSGYATFNGVDWVNSGATASQFTGYTAGSGALTLAPATNFSIAGAASTAALGTINSLKLTGGAALTLGGQLSFTTNPGGVLFDNSGGTASITGSTLGTAAQELVVTTNGSSPAVAPAPGAALTTGNALTISSTQPGGASLTKTGTGTLIFTGPRTYTGNTVINQGAIQMSGATADLGVLTTAGNQTVIRQGAILDVNGAGASTALYTGGPSFAQISIGALTGTGLITNSNAAQSTVSLGGTATTGTTTFGGTLQDGTGILNVVINGTSARSQAILGAQPYTGVTVINTGNLAVTRLADGGTASGLGASSNAASNLIFNGGTLTYTGAAAAAATSGGGIYQTTQTPSVSTNRLFTLAGNATIQSSGTYGNEAASAGTGANNASLIFSNTGDLAFVNAGTRTLTLGGSSIGDNEMRIRLRNNPNLNEALSFTKADGGLWILNPSTSNDYTGPTTISGGALRAITTGAVLGIPTNSNITLSGGVLEVAGTSFTRTLGTGAGQVQLTAGSTGFAAGTTDRLVVNLSGGAALTWGSGSFNPATALVLGSSTALGETEITNAINLGTAARTVTVNNNGNTGTMVTAGILSGVISGGAGGTLTKNGGGVLMLGNANTYVGNTIVNNGNLIVTSIGNATGTTSSSLGASGGALQFNPDADLNGLFYVGGTETATRPWQFVSANLTANRTYRIDASGSGALTLAGTFTNSLAGSAAGRVITLELRGSNTDNNMITSVLSNATGTNTPALAVGKNDGGTWVLNPASANSFTGGITVSGGNLGLTSNGIGATTNISIGNAGIFAFGGALSTSAIISGNNATAVIAGQNNITVGGLTKNSGNNAWTISNNLENGALFTVNGPLLNLETTNNQTINFRGYGSTVLNGVIQNSGGAATTAINIALAPDASFTMAGAANTYSGTTTLTDGILILDKTAAPLGTGIFAFNGGTLRVGATPTNLIGANAITNAVQLNNSPPKVDGAKSIEFSGGVALNASRNLQNELTGGASLTISGVGITNSVASTLTIYGAGNTSISGPYNAGTGVNGLQLSGTGTLALTGTNLATGALTASRGTITLSGTSGGSWNAGTAQVNSGGTLTLDNSGGNNAAGRLFDTGAFTGNGGTLNFINNGTASTETTGALTLNNATTRITMSGAGTGAITFASVAIPNSGSSLDLSTISGLGTTNQVFFTAAPTLTNNIIPRIFVNGGTDFATYTGSGVVAFTGYNNANNFNTAAATDTMNLTASAATTANRTVNALKLNGTGLAVTGAASNRLTLTAAGILNTGGNNALSINEVAFAANTALIQVASGSTLTVNSGLTGTNISKFLAGDLTFGSTARSFITGTHNLFGGVTTLTGSADTFFPNQNFLINDGATLNLNGGGQYIGNLNSTGVLPGTGGTINGGGALVTNGGGTFGGTITSGTSLGRVQGGTLAFQSAQTYTGSTLLMGGTTTLENDATLLNTSDISLNFATLSLSNNSSLQTQINNRVGDAIPISLRSGGISVTGRLTTAATETLGAVSALQGASTITVANGGGTLTSMDLTLASLTRSQGTTVNFVGTNLGQQGNNARIAIASGPAAVGSGVLGAWAIANTTDYAAYNAGLGVGIVGQGGFTGYDAQVISAANVSPASGTFAADNITNIFSTAASSILLGAGTTTTGLLRVGGAFTTDVNFTNNADTLNLGLGGILRSNDNFATSIGSVASRGIITSGTSELVVYNAANTTGATVMTINSSIQGAGTALVKSGGGVLALTGVNTYGGGTTVAQGTLELRGTTTGDVVIPAGGLSLINSTVTQFVTAGTNPTGQGQINSTNAVTLRGGSTLTLTGANTLAGISFDNNGGTATPTVTSGGTLTLTNSNPITVTSSNPSTVATIAGTLSIPSGAQTINTPAIQLNGITVSNLTPTLAISANIISPGASIVKSGNGLLQLSGQNLFNGLTVSGGGVVVGASSSPAQGGAGLTSGPLGVGSVSMAAGTTLFSNSTAAIGNAVSFAGTPTFDTTDNTARTLTLNGAISGAGWTGTPTVAVSNPGLTVALLGNLPAFSSITKTGLGSLIFNSTNYSGDYDATALGNPLAISLLHDGTSPNIGNSTVETIALAGDVIFNTVGTGTITVNRGGGGLPFNLAANKIISAASINTVLTNGLIVANTNGYGLSVLDSGALVGTPTYTVNTATASNVTQGLYMSGALSGTGFIKAGPGTLVLDNAGNTFVGDITINQGVVSASGNAQLGAASNLIRLAASVAGTATFRATSSYTLANPIQLTGTANTRAIEVTSGNTLTLGTAFDLNAGAGNAATLAKNDLGTLLLNVDNPSWTGGININQGAVLVNNNTLTTPLGTGTITINGINLTGPAGAIGAALQLAGGVTITNPLSLQTTGNVAVGGINGAGQLENVSGNNTYSGPITVGFDAAIGSTSGTLTLASAITIGNQAPGRLFSFVGAGNTVIGAGTTVTGNMFGLQKFGSGTLEVRVPFGSQTGSTGVQVRAGTLLLNGTGTLNATTAPNLVQSAAILRLDNSGTNTNNRLTGRAVTLQGGTFDFISNNTTETAGALLLDQGANIINNGGTGTSALTFASLTAPSAGSSLNVTGTFGTATNFVKFTAAPALTPATTGILNRVTVNGNEFASYNATNGIVPFTGYSPATNILGVAATGTFRATSATANSLTGNQTINALTLQSGGLVGNVPNVGGLPGNNPPTTLTITSGSILAQGTGAGVASTLSVPIVAFGGAEAIVHVASGQALTITSGMSGTAGLSKHLPGTLSLGAQQFISGTTFVNGGTLSLQSGSTNTLLFNNAVAVNTDGTLDLNGSNQFISGLSSAAAGGGTGLAGGTVTNSAVGQSTLVINANNNFGGVISGNIYLNKTGTGALNLQAPQTYTGPTLLTGGITTLNDNGALPNTAQPININYATLSLANGNLYDVPNRVNNAAPITLIGGAIAIAGRQQGASSETLGAITLAGGQNVLTTNAGGTGTNSLDVTIASLSRSDTTSTLRMNAGGQIGSAARLFITTAPTLTNNIIGPWAFRDRAWASYDATYGVGPLDGVGFAGYAGSGLNSNPLATDNVFVSATATTMLSNTTVGTLAFNQVGAAINVNLGGNTLTIQGGGLLVGQNNDNFDLSLTNGNLTSGAAGVGGDFFVHHLNFGGTGRTLTFGSAITNNGAGAVRLILSSGQQGETVASGATILNGVNTYTGGTIVNSGPLTLGATGTLGSGGLTVKNGIFTQTAGGIIPSQALNLGGGALVNLVGNNSLTNLTIENNGGGAPTLNPTGILTLTGVAGITATTSSPGTISTIGTGTLDLNANASFPINVGATIVSGVDVAPWQPGLIISSVIQNGGINKTGLGVLQLGAASTFTGGVTVAAGGGLALSSDTNSTLLNDPVVTGPVGTGTLTMGANTTMLAIGGARTITNNVTFLGDTVFNGTNNLTLNGITTIPSLWNATVTAPQMTVTIGDASPSLATDEINKFGLGTLVIGNYAGTLNIAGGLSFIGDGNTLSTPENINLGGNLVLAGDTAVTVNRSGSAPNSRNKTIQRNNLTTGNILSVSNQNGYGLEFTGTTTITGVSHYSVANATASNLVQGLTLSGVVSDGGANLNMIKSGVGTLALTNAGNSFGGIGSTIQVLNGILSASSDGALGAAGNGVDLQVDGTTGVGFRSTGTFTTGRTFQLNAANNAFEVTAGNILTLSAPFTLSAPTNTLTKNDNGVFAINADNTGWTGAITVNAGALRAGHANALGSGTITVNNAVGSSVQLTDGITFNSPIVIATTGASGYDSRGVIESVSGINTISGLITQNSGIGATIGAAAGATLNINGAIATVNSTTFNAGAGATINLNSVYANGGAGGPTFNKIGTGALNVTVNQPAVATAINVNGGALNVSGSGVTLGITGLISVNASGTLTIDDTTATAARLGNRAVTIQGGTFNYLGSTSTETSTGALTFARMGGIYNQTASTSATVTFGSLALGTDATANFTGTGLGTASNRLLFTTAPTLVGGAVATTNGILARATVNGSTFATYNTNGTTVNTNGIQGFTGYNVTSATNINSAAATDTVDANAAMTTKNLTANRTINALRLSGGTAQTVGGAAFNQLTLTAGGILATGATTHVLSVPVLNNAAVQNVIHVDTGSTLNISSTIVGTAGTVKDGAGTLIISSPASTSGVANVNGNTNTGNVTLTRGTVRLSGGTNTLAPGQFLVMGGPAATLDLNGTSQQISGLLTDITTSPNAGGSIIGGVGSQLVITQDANNRAYAGTIGGSVNLVRSGQNTLTLVSPNNYTGTTLVNGGTLTLQSDATLSATSSIDLNYATLSLDNNAGLNDLTNRINDAAAITLRGGAINFQGRAQTASTETLGAVTLAQGTSSINSVIGGTGINSADLTLTSLTRAVGGGTVNFTAATGGLIGSNSRIIIPTINTVSTSTAFNALDDGILGGWAVIGASDWASYVPGLGVGAMGQQGFPQYSNTVTTATTLANSGATDNVNLNTNAITSLVNNDLTVNSLRFGNVTANTVNIASGKTLTLDSGGLLFFSTAQQNLGAAVNQGNLTSGGPELFVYTQGTGPHVINSVITGTNSLVKSGANTLNLAGANTYSGGTTVNQGTLNVLATSLIPLATTPANGLILNSGTVNLNAAGAIASGNIVTINSAGSTLNLFGDNTLAGLVLNNNGGGNANLQVNTFNTASATGAGEFGVLTIGASGIQVTSSNVASTAIIVGRTDFGASANTVNVAPISANGLDVNPLQAALAIQGIVGTAGGINKTGNGVLQFNAQAHYSGPTTVTAGGIRIGVTNGGSRSSALTLNAGTHLNLNGLNTAWGSLAGSGSVVNSGAAATLTVGFDNTSTTFSGQLTRFNDAVINGVALQKIGTGVLSMTAAQAFASGTTGAMTVNGGTLRYVDAGAAFAATAASGGVTFSLNNGGTLALDNSGTANVNNRLGLNTVGTLALQGGKLTITGSPSAATTETITTFNVNNGGGRIELTPNASSPLTLAITTLSGQNNAGSLVVTGITGAASANGVANLTITTPTLIAAQGTGANGTATMPVRSDILADANVAGLGTGFLVRDSVTNNYRALGTSSAGAAVPGEFETAANTALLTNWGATENVKVASAQTLFTHTPANTLTFEGTSSIASGLAAAFGNYGPGGSLLTQNLSTAAGLLVLDGATATVQTGALAGSTAGTTMNLHVVGTGTLGINGAFGVGNTGGIIKSSGGLLSFNNRAYYTGVTTINNGTLRLNSGAANTLAVVPTTGAATVSQVNLNGTGSVLDLMGRNQAIGALTSVNPLPGNGGTVQNTGAAAVLTTMGTGTFSGAITGNLALTRAGNSTTTLTNANTYTGATIVRGGVLELRDSGTLASTAGLTLNYGTLNWNNFGLNAAGSPNPTRIAATNAVTLQGGTFTINGAGSTDTVATLNSVTVTGGNNVINTLPYINMGSTVQLTIGNLVRNAATKSGVVFNGFSANNSAGANTLGGQGLTTNSNIFLTQVNGAAFSATNLVNNLIGGWAVADGSTFATYNNTFGVVAMGNVYGGFTAPGFTGTDLSAALVATGNYNDGANRTLTTGNKTANSIRFAGATAAQTITPVSGTTYSIGVGFIANQNQTTTLGAVDATNTLTGTGADLYFYNNQSTMIINPAIIGTQALVSNGPATLSLRPQFASNTYSGGTFINAGTTTLIANPGFIAIPGDLTINNATVTMTTNAGQIAATSNVAINGGGILNMTGTNTLNSVTFNNEGGTGNPTVATATLLILSSATPVTSINNSLATTPLISGTALQFSNANPVLTVNDGLAETDLTISAPITQNAGMTSLSKTGTGVLALSGASTFTTGFNLNQGSLMFGVNSTGTLPTVTNGPVGTGTLTIAGGTSLLSDGTIRTIGNATTVSGDFTFAGPVAGNGVTLSGAMNLGAAGRTINVDSPANTSTISGAITSTATGTALTKSGAGTLLLSSASSNFGGAGVAVTGGILRNGIINAIPSASAIAVSAGAGYDLNGFAQTVDGISGEGFITNSANSAQTLTVSSTANSSTFAGVLTDNILAQSASRLNLTKAGAGTTLTLTGANTYSGVTNVSAGILSITNALALGTTANGTVVTSGGSLELQNNITVTGETLSIAGIGSASNGALRNLSGNNTFASTVTLTAAASIQSDAGLLTLDVPTGNAITATNQNVTFTGAGNTTVVDAIATGSGSLTKTGSGNLTLSGTNTYTGGTAINGTTGSVVTVNSAGALGSTGTVSFGGGTLQYTANNTTDYSSRFSTAASQAISIDTNSQNVTLVTALISSGGSLNKQGAGALTVTAANTYTAGTTVNGGTLLVNNTTGSGTGSGAVSVSNVGTVLGGNGSIAGDLTVNAGALIAPGSAANTAGTLTIGGSTVVIAGNGVAENRLNFDYTTATGNVPGLTPATWSSYSGALLTGNGGQSNDLLNFTASTTSLTWNTGGKISLNQIGSAYSWVQGDVFNLLDWTALGDSGNGAGSIGGSFNSAVDFNLPTLTGGLAWDTSRFVTTGAIAVVPEPSRALLMLFGFMALFFRRRRQD